jgi:predicted flavoprotein YhiN
MSNKQDFLRKLHENFKKEYPLNELLKPEAISEYEAFWKMDVNADKVNTKLEKILIYIRGINGVTIVRSSDTTVMKDRKYSTIIHVKYTPEAFNVGVSLQEKYDYLEQQIRSLSEGISLTRLTPAPGQKVEKKGK